MKCDLLIIDGRHMLYRTSDAFSNLSVEIDGEEIPTGGMYGFLNIATKVHSRYGGKVAVAWEGHGNFRVDLYPQYKNRHKEMDDDKLEFIREMGAQELWLKRILASAGVAQYEGVRCEADDVIGRLAHKVGIQKRKRVIIYSGDSDLRQLIESDHIWTVSPGKGRIREQLYGPAEALEKDGVPSFLISDMKALSGDSSDNVPGVRGIGPKTAATLLNHYGGLAAVMAAAVGEDEEWPVAERFKDSISQCEDLELYHKLTTIDVECGMKKFPSERRQARVVEMMKLFHFRSLLAPAELQQVMGMGK